MDSDLYKKFSEIDIRVGKIIQAKEFPEAQNPSYKLKIDFGEKIGVLKSSAQITNYSIRCISSSRSDIQIFIRCSNRINYRHINGKSDDNNSADEDNDYNNNN